MAGVITPKKGDIMNESSMADWQRVDMSMGTIEPEMGVAPTSSCWPGKYIFELFARPGVNIGWNAGKGSGLSVGICGSTVE